MNNGTIQNWITLIQLINEYNENVQGERDSMNDGDFDAGEIFSQSAHILYGDNEPSDEQLDILDDMDVDEMEIMAWSSLKIMLSMYNDDDITQSLDTHDVHMLSLSL